MDPAPPLESHPVAEAIRSARDRVLGGLILALPIAVTMWVFYWLYSTLRTFVLDPSADVVRWLLGAELLANVPPWWDRFIAPALGGSLVLTTLYLLGYFARTRISRALDWVFLRVPLVTIVYKAVRNVLESLSRQGQAPKRHRVVLVPFPHAGSKAVGFVSRSLRDARSGKTILCVSVLTGVVPPAGFTLFLPEEDAIELDWSVNETLQVILSGGMTAPATIKYSTEPPQIAETFESGASS